MDHSVEKGKEEETQHEVQTQFCDDECHEHHEENWNKGKEIHPI